MASAIDKAKLRMDYNTVAFGYDSFATHVAHLHNHIDELCTGAPEVSGRELLLKQAKLGLYRIFCENHPLAEDVRIGNLDYVWVAGRIAAHYDRGIIRNFWPKVDPCYDEDAAQLIGTLGDLVGYSEDTDERLWIATNDFVTTSMRRDTLQGAKFLFWTNALGILAYTSLGSRIEILIGGATGLSWIKGRSDQNQRRAYLIRKAVEAANFAEGMNRLESEIADAVLSPS